MLILLFIVAITCQQDDEMLIFTPSASQDIFNSSQEKELLFTDFLESLVDSLEHLEQEDDATFLAMDSATPQMEMPSPFDFFSNIFSMIPFGAPSDSLVGEMVEIETVLVEGHEKRTVTRTQVKNGVKTVTQEVITTTTTSELLDKSNSQQLSSDFTLVENKLSESEEIESLEQINLDDYIQDVEEPIVVENQSVLKNQDLQEPQSNYIRWLAGGAVVIFIISAFSYGFAQTRQKSKKQEMKFMID